MLADRMMRGEEGSEFEARHGSSLLLFLFLDARPNYEVGRIKAIAESRPGPLADHDDAAKPNLKMVERDPLEDARFRQDKDLGCSGKWRGRRAQAQSRLERFFAKARPGLDPGWLPVRVKKTRQTKK
jgi:hypothetical protein